MDDVTTTVSAPPGDDAAGSPPRRRFRRLATLARHVPRLPFLALLLGPMILAGALTAWGNANDRGDHDHSAAAALRVVSADRLADEYGVRVDLVAVTASGGLVDLRFTVLDSTKAEHLFHGDSLPSLYVESSGRVLAARPGMHHNVQLANGARYFVLYSNSGGAVHAGEPVSVVIGDVRLAAVRAER